jgi:hypothetical protein
MKAPNTKLQDPDKLQAPSSKFVLRESFGVWDLDLVWSLGLGAWSFSSGCFSLAHINYRVSISFSHVSNEKRAKKL